jgi:hypothetical protein
LFLQAFFFGWVGGAAEGAVFDDFDLGFCWSGCAGFF